MVGVWLTQPAVTATVCWFPTVCTGARQVHDSYLCHEKTNHSAKGMMIFEKNIAFIFANSHSHEPSFCNTKPIFTHLISVTVTHEHLSYEQFPCSNLLPPPYHVMRIETRISAWLHHYLTTRVFDSFDYSVSN
jgi:hypothetical protein